eukprot:TRINITY_DN9792_c0_g1_i2.p1 TRINITY_DN9792_c0_g1~~TRINITY_DN9792_c0_g1_i2.p1  ORF type:complete len:481 (+),score=107.41 TRINITY_DN9792_c0_g1_i2:52-1494(+)
MHASTHTHDDPTEKFDFSLLPHADSPLVPQAPDSGLTLLSTRDDEARTFIIVNGNVRYADDWRCYDAKTGALVCNSHYDGQNPYDKISSRLSMSGLSVESTGRCLISGLSSPIAISHSLLHRGRREVSLSGDVKFAVQRRSKLATASLARSFHVAVDGNVVLHIEGSAETQRINFVSAKREVVATARKPAKSLFAAGGWGGCELQLDVAPGVDHSAVLVALLALQQTPRSHIERMLGSFVYMPLDEGDACPSSPASTVASVASPVASSPSRATSPEKVQLLNCVSGARAKLSAAPKEQEAMVMAHPLNTVNGMPMQLQVEPCEWLVAGPYTVNGKPQLVALNWYEGKDGKEEACYGAGVMDNGKAVGYFAWAGKQDEMHGLTRDMLIRRRKNCHYVWARPGAVPEGAVPYEHDVEEGEEVAWHPWVLTRSNFWMVKQPAGSVGKCSFSKGKGWVAACGSTERFDIDDGLVLYEVLQAALQ